MRIATSIHDAFRAVEDVRTSHVAGSISVKKTAILLATARVRIADRFRGWHDVRALVDQGLDSTFISERLAQRLRLPRSAASVAIFGVGGVKGAAARGRVALSLFSRRGGSMISVAALVLSRLTAYAGSIEYGKKSWAHIQDLELADPDYAAADAIDALLGADVHAAIVRGGLRREDLCEPVAQETSLGWILSGPMEGRPFGASAHAFQCRLKEDLSDLV